MQPIWNYILIRTEHPKLLIFETTRGNTSLKNKQLLVENMDLFTYINSKFIYVERHIFSKISKLYHDLSTHKCQLEQQVFKNFLIIVTQAQDEFAYHLVKGPGYMSIIVEVVHIVKCIPIEVKFRQTDQCYLHLPIDKGNDKLFPTPCIQIII